MSFLAYDIQGCMILHKIFMIVPMEMHLCFFVLPDLLKSRGKCDLFFKFKKCVMKNINNIKGKNIQILPGFSFFPPRYLIFSWKMKKK